MRVFGGGSELFIDREREFQVLTQLNGMGFGAQLLGMFSNGRIEEWLEARSMVEREVAMPHVIPVIAARLAELHACPVDTGEAAPQLWPTIRKWCVFWSVEIEIEVTGILMMSVLALLQPLWQPSTAS